MPLSPCLAPECQDLRNELSRARHKISMMQKEIRHLEGMLETRDSDRTTLLSDGFDESVYIEYIGHLSAEIVEIRADFLDDMVVELESEVTTLRTAYYRVKRKSENRKTELKNLGKCLKKRKDELKMKEMIELQNDMLREEIASVSSDRDDLLDEIEELEEKFDQEMIKHEEEMDAYKMTTERLDKELTETRSKLYQTEDRNAFLEALIQRCQETEQELLDKLDETEAKLLEKEDHSTFLQGVIQRCAEIEQELLDKLDETEVKMLEKEDHSTFLQGVIQRCAEIEQELYDQQQDLEARVIEWFNECSRLQALLSSDSPDVSEPSPDPECVQEDIGSVTGALDDDVLYSKEEKQINCPTFEDKNFEFRQQEVPKSRKRKRSLSASWRNRSKRRPDSSYSITTRPGIRRFFYLRRSWYRDKKNLEAQISILVDIDEAFTNLCVTTKRLCEAFRPRVDEVVKWVVRSPFLNDYDPAMKYDLFQQILRIRITGGGCVEDVVAMWCEGHGNAEPSWNNLLLALEESGCSCLLQTARCLRANLADYILKRRLDLHYGLSEKVNCLGCDQEIPFFPEEIAYGLAESTAPVFSPVGQRQDPEGSEDT